jgi:hypothetical protein
LIGYGFYIFEPKNLSDANIFVTEKHNYGLGAAPGGDESTSAEGRANPLARASFTVPFQHKFST